MLTVPLLPPSHEAGLSEASLEEARRNIQRWEAMNPPAKGLVRSIRQDVNARPVLVFEAPAGVSDPSSGRQVFSIAVYARNLSTTGVSFLFAREATPLAAVRYGSAQLPLARLLLPGSTITLLFPLAQSLVARPIVAQIVRNRPASENVSEAGAEFKQIDAVAPSHRSFLGLESGLPRGPLQPAIPVNSSHQAGRIQSQGA